MKNLDSLVHYTWKFGSNYCLQGVSPIFPWVIPKPLYVSLDIGPLCNLRCKQCDFWKIKKMPTAMLTAKQIEKVLGELKSWLGPFRLVFTGAEPFINKDIFAILQIASQLDLYTVMVSNGQLINNENQVRRVVASGLTVLNISLDGNEGRTHDYLRGVKGAHRKAVQTLRLIQREKQRQRKGPTLYVNTIIMGENLDQLVPLARWVASEKFDGIHFQVLESKHLFGGREKYDAYWFKKDSLWPNDQAKVAKAVADLKRLLAKGYPIKNSQQELEDFQAYYRDPLEYTRRYKFCYTGVNNFSITVNGDVRLCFALSAIGNVLKQKPQVIWQGHKAWQLRKIIRSCDRPCRILPCNKRYEFSQLTGAFWRNLKKLI